MSGYTKLFSSILMSSIWDEPTETRLVWVTLLALADRDGHVDGTAKSLARVARVPVDACKRALACFLGPDDDDRSGVANGQRIVAEHGGWTLVNYDHYRHKMSREERQERDKMRKRNARASSKRPQASEFVRDVSHTDKNRTDQTRSDQEERESGDPALRVTHWPSRVTVTQEEAEAEAEAEVEEEVVQEEQERVSRRAALPPLAEAWNTITQRPIARCMGISRKRSTQIAARMAERPLDEWRGIISRVQASSFCRGENDRGWVASFDWLIAGPDNALKILEGKYDDRAPAQQPRREPSGSAVPNAEATRKMLDAIYAPDEA